jgi:hypothetical protein
LQHRAVAAPAVTRPARAWRVLRLDALIGISVTGVVYTTVLAGTQHLTGWAVTDTVFHYVPPIAAVAGWLVFGPRPRLDGRSLALALAWPLAYFGYTLLHGHYARWYGARYWAGDRYLRW